jgi:hypothetical protein
MSSTSPDEKTPAASAVTADATAISDESAQCDPSALVASPSLSSSVAQFRQKSNISQLESYRQQLASLVNTAPLEERAQLGWLFGFLLLCCVCVCWFVGVFVCLSLELSLELSLSLSFELSLELSLSLLTLLNSLSLLNSLNPSLVSN